VEQRSGAEEWSRGVEQRSGVEEWSRGVEQRSRVEQRSGVEQRSIEIRAKAAEEYKVRVYLLCFPQLV
jgi:hypothetical protein